MTITLYNTRTRTKEPFEPIDRENVRMYVCGPTVYDRAHIGNARPVVVFDVLYRLLRHTYGEDHVTYVRNFTDVDDKIIARAQEVRREGETLEEATHRVTDETIRWYHEDMDALGALGPTHEPRCTETIPEMVAMIGELIGKGFAYEAEGHVLFEVKKWDEYGEHARKPLDEMREGARVEVAPYKRDPMDFVLWKPSTPEQPGWDSPWGRGRPGWHIECSAMARELLGEVFDIHGGGIDLIFPHHQNEIAQSCCAHGTDRMANFWLYNGFLMVEGQKMSKSLGNFFTVRDLLDKGWPGEVIRFVLLKTKYREPLDWTERSAEEATAVIDRWRQALDIARSGYAAHEADGQSQSEAVLSSLNDDLNTWEAIRGIGILAKDLVDGELSASELKETAIKFLNGLALLGFDDLESAKDLQVRRQKMAEWDVADLIDSLLAIRAEARAAKDFAKADAIRAGLDAAGVMVMDRAGAASEWELTPDFDPAKLEALK